MKKPIFHYSVAFYFIGLSFLFFGCVSTPPALLPTSTQVQGIAVIPKTETAKKALGRQQPRIVQCQNHQTVLFSVLEMNKTDKTTSIDTDASDYVIKWKLRNNDNLDRSQLYLRLSSPKTFVYESDLGSCTKKYAIKTNAEDAKKIWNIVGVTPDNL